MNRFLIAPSILSANFARLGEEIMNIVPIGIDLLHFDVMDNHYVPNLSIGPMVLKSLRDYGIDVPVDVHLMARPIDRLISDFASAGATYISFHPETTEHIDRSLELIRECGCRVGIVLNPVTTVSYLEYVMHKIDLITLMSVNPGFPGQSFICTLFRKINQVRQLIDSHNYDIDLAVDGGINLDNIRLVLDAGANVFIIGSSIFKSKNPSEELSKFRSLLLD